MDKLISEELIRQIKLMGYDRSKPISESLMLPPMSPVGVGLGPAVAKNMSENEKEKNYDYLFTKWAPYVCGLGGPGGISPDNSFGSFSASRCGWAYNKLSPMKICSTPIIDVEYDSPSYNAYGGKSYYAKEVNKRRKEGKKFTQNGGGVVVKKSTGTVYNTYWCECKKDVEFWALTDYNSNRPTGSYFRLDGPLSFEHATDQPQWTSINSWFDLKRCTSTNKAEEWVDKHYHDIIPIVSFVLSFFFPIGTAIGAALEVTDAAKYQEEGNTYAAGLAFIFAMIGPLDAGLGPLITRYGAKLLAKITAKSTKFTDEEAKLLKALTDKKKIMKLVKLGTTIKLVRQIMVRIKNWKIFGMFLLRLVNLGLISLGVLRKIGVMVGGTFITWDYIAYKYGIENTVPLSALKSSDWKILKYLGEAGDYLQPFTTGVMSQSPEVEKILKMAEEEFSISKRILNSLDESITEGSKYSVERFGSVSDINVLFIQYVLKALGFTKKINSSFYAGMSTAGIFSFSNAQNISKVQVYEYNAPPMMMSQDAISKLPLSANSGKLIKEWNPYNGKPISMPLLDAVKKSKKYFAIITDNLGRQKGIKLTSSFISKLFNFKDDGNYDMTFRWGYYDKFTKNSVMEYQKTNGLFVDGVVGSDTLKKLKDSAKKLKDIKNYNNVEMTDEEIEKIKKNTIKQFEYLKRELDKKEENADEIQRAFEQEKSETQNTINVVVTDIKNKDKEPTKEEVDEFEGLLEKISSGGLKEDDLK